MSDASELPEDDVTELRALYARLQPPPLADDLGATDAETARAVGWVRDAWKALEVPPARVPRDVVFPRRAPPRVLRRVLAIAAGLLVVAGAAASVRALLRRTASAPEHVARQPAPEPRGIVVAALPDRLELVSGPVRLVLLDPPSSEPGD